MHSLSLLALSERNYFGSLPAVIFNSLILCVYSGFYVHFAHGIRNFQRTVKDISKNLNVDDE
jgi:hypothetical protein